MNHSLQKIKRGTREKWRSIMLEDIAHVMKISLKAHFIYMIKIFLSSKAFAKIMPLLNQLLLEKNITVKTFDIFYFDSPKTVDLWQEHGMFGSSSHEQNRETLSLFVWFDILFDAQFKLYCLFQTI